MRLFLVLVIRGRGFDPHLVLLHFLVFVVYLSTLPVAYGYIVIILVNNGFLAVLGE